MQNNFRLVVKFFIFLSLMGGLPHLYMRLYPGPGPIPAAIEVTRHTPCAHRGYTWFSHIMKMPSITHATMDPLSLNHPAPHAHNARLLELSVKGW